LDVSLYVFLETITITGRPEQLPHIVDDLSIRTAAMGSPRLPTSLEWPWLHDCPRLADIITRLDRGFH